jgi:hypothetical protein
MVGAEGGSALDNEQRVVRTLAEYPEGDQAVGEPATDQNQLCLHGFPEAALVADGATEGSADAIPGIGMGGTRFTRFMISSSQPTLATLR